MTKATGRKRGRPPKTMDTALTARQERALAIEIQNPKGNSIGGLSVSNLARKVGEKPQTVSKWRGAINYRKSFEEGLKKRRLEKICDPSSPVDEDEAARLVEIARVQKNKRTHIESYVNSNWTGPFEEPGGGQWFKSKDEFIKYLLDNDLLPAKTMIGFVRKSNLRPK
jgi:hypothetical protein